MTYKPQPTVVEGGQDEVRVGDDEVSNILYDILRELRIMNLHLQSMTQEKINKTDVEI